MSSFTKVAALLAAVLAFFLPISYTKGEESALPGSHDDPAFQASEKAQVEKWKIEAEQGDAQAQLELGLAYCIDGSPQNDVEGLEWIRKAAAQDKQAAMFTLGHFYNKGINGAQKNQEEAVSWLRKAADKGHATAQEELQEIEGAKAGDTVFVIKSFTIDSDGGLTGFPVGKEVKVIDVKNDKLLVEDKNKKQNWQSKDFFDGKKPVAKLVAKPVNTAREPVISNLLFEGVCIRSDFENGTISVGCKILITDYSGVAITNPNNETIIMGSTYDSGREDLIGINWKELPNCQSLIKIDPRTGIGELIIGGVPGSGKVPKGAIFRMSPK